MYKIYNGISPTIMNAILKLRHRNLYNIRSWTDFDVPKIRTVKHSPESFRYLGPKIWEIIPTHVKQ